MSGFSIKNVRDPRLQDPALYRRSGNERFLSATTTRRVFSHVTKTDVETPENIELFKNRSVFTLDGKYYVYYILR